MILFLSIFNFNIILIDGEHIYSHPNPLQYIIPDFLQHPQKNILNNPSSNTK